MLSWRRRRGDARAPNERTGHARHSAAAHERATGVHANNWFPRQEALLGGRRLAAQGAGARASRCGGRACQLHSACSARAGERLTCPPIAAGCAPAQHALSGRAPDAVRLGAVGCAARTVVAAAVSSSSARRARRLSSMITKAWSMLRSRARKRQHARRVAVGLRGADFASATPVSAHSVTNVPTRTIVRRSAGRSVRARVWPRHHARALVFVRRTAYRRQAGVAHMNACPSVPACLASLLALRVRGAARPLLAAHGRGAA